MKISLTEKGLESEHRAGKGGGRPRCSKKDTFKVQFHWDEFPETLPEIKNENFFNRTANQKEWKEGRAQKSLGERNSPIAGSLRLTEGRVVGGTGSIKHEPGLGCKKKNKKSQHTKGKRVAKKLHVVKDKNLSNTWGNHFHGAGGQGNPCGKKKRFNGGEVGGVATNRGGNEDQGWSIQAKGRLLLKRKGT